MEGQGNFVEEDADGNPAGWELVEPPVPDARNVYGGAAPNTVTRQNTAPLGLERSSYLVNHPLVDGDPMPNEGDHLAPLPRPRKPRLKKVTVSRAGYPPGTAQNPHWVAFAWGIRQRGKIRWTELARRAPLLAPTASPTAWSSRTTPRRVLPTWACLWPWARSQQARAPATSTYKGRLT